MYKKAISIAKKNPAPDVYIEFDKLLAEDKNNFVERALLFRKAPKQIQNNLNFVVRKILFYLDTNQKQKALTVIKRLGFIPTEVFSDARLEGLENDSAFYQRASA